MAPHRQIEANRSNVKRSTGPKTPGGKATSGQNALRHGLARSDISDSAVTEKFAVAIASGLPHQIASDAAVALARSKLALLRIRSLRQDMLVALVASPPPAGVKRLKGLERYERAATEAGASLAKPRARLMHGHLASFWIFAPSPLRRSASPDRIIDCAPLMTLVFP